MPTIDKSVITGADENVCIFNDGVGCTVQMCADCGWNPAVFKRRRKELRRMERQGEVPHVQIQKRRSDTL